MGTPERFPRESTVRQKAHGAECRAGALEEMYHDAWEYFERPDNPHVVELENRAVRWALSAACSELSRWEGEATDDDGLLMRAWPFAEHLTDPETLGSDCDAHDDTGPPEEWYRYPRMFLHKVMRLAFKEGHTSVVECLERLREQTAAQLTYALADAERKGHGREAVLARARARS